MKVTSTVEQQLVSIIIPCYNAADTIALCLESCKSQTHTKLEIVLVDNNCSDDTVTLAETALSGWTGKCAVVTCETQGVTHARNRGFESASGDFIQWLDADDTLGPEKIERQVEFLVAETDYDIAYGDWRWNIGIAEEAAEKAVTRLRLGVPAIAYGDRNWQMDPNNDGVAFNDYRLTQSEDYLLRLLQDKWLPSNAYLLRRSAAERLQELRGWNPDTRYADDREYFTMAALSGLRFGYVEGAVCEYNTWSDTQTTKQTSMKDRVANLEGVFQRFRDFSDTDHAVSLSDEHRALLAQNRQLWGFVQGRVALGEIEDKRYIVQFKGSGKRELVSGVEAAIVMVMHKFKVRFALCLEDHAKIIANQVPNLWERHSELMAALDRLCDIKVLQRIKS